MDLALRIFVMAVSVLVFTSVIYMLIKKRLNESNSILWLIIAFMTLVFGFFPSVLDWLARLLGISYEPALLFLMSILMIMLITFKGSLELSKMNAKINELATALAILKEENNRLIARFAESDKSGDRDI